MRSRFLWFAPALLLLASSAPLAADPPTDPEPPEQHEDVLVSATRSEQSAADAPVSATVVQRQEILESPASTVDDLLRIEPGINLPPTSSSYVFPSQDTLSIRGTGAKRALVLFDGAPLNDPFSGAIQWSKVLFPDLDRIEVVRGGAGSLYGNEAMGGLVNIVSRSVLGDDLTADVSYGSYATRTATASVRGRVAPGLGVGAVVGWYETDGFVREAPKDRGLLDLPSATRNFSGAFRTEWEGEDGAEASLHVGTFRQNISLGTPISRADRTISDASVGGKFPGLGGGLLQLSGYFQHQIFSYDNTAFVSGQGRNAEFHANHHDDPVQGLGGSAFWSTVPSEFLDLLAVGVDVQQNRGEDRATNFTSSGNVANRVTAGGIQNFVGVFVEAGLRPLRGLEVLVNARMDFWRNIDGKLEASDIGESRFADRSDRQFDPRLAVRYEIAPWLAMRAAGYRAFRAPFLRELYYGTLTKTSQSLPNPELSPERSFGGEAGFDLGTSRELQVTVFRSDIDDIISQVQTQATPIRVLKWFNVGNARSQGIEVSASGKPLDRVELQGSYCYTDARVTGHPLDPTLAGKLIPFVPRQALSGSARIGLPAGVLATLRGRAYSRMYTDAANVLSLDPAAVFDFALERTFWGDLTVTAECENLFDRRYIADVSVGHQIGDPREFRVGIRWTPSFGGRTGGP